MPPNKKGKTLAKSCSSFDYHEEDQTSPVSNGAVDLPATTSMRSRKRHIYEQEVEQDEQDESGTFTGEMQSLISGFGADISKTLDAKRKRLESFTQAALKTSNRNEKVEEVFQRQQRERGKLRDEYQKQMMSVLTQMESDIDKTKDAEEKLEEMFKQQQKLIQQQCVVHANRLKSFKNIHDQYSKGIKELERSQLDQQGSVQQELRQELGYLQKKILHETQNQEMASVRKTLQTMLAQV